MSYITNRDNLVIQFTIFKGIKTVFGNMVEIVFFKILNFFFKIKFFMFSNHFNTLLLKNK
jgi:hypothetical protein